MASPLSLLTSLPQMLGGGSGATAAASGTKSAAGGSGMSGLFGGLVSAFVKVAPSVMSAIPIVGAFAPLVSMAMPLLGGLTGATAGGTQVGKDASNQNGGIDAATAAALIKMMEQQQGTSSLAAQVRGGQLSTPATLDEDPAVAAAAAAARAKRPPAIQVGGGTQPQIATVNAALAAIANDPAGRAMFTRLNGHNIAINILDDATYQAAAAKGGLNISPDAIFLPASAAADPRSLTTALVNGLASAARM